VALQSLTTENTKFTEKSTENDNSVDAHTIGQIQLDAAITHYNEGNYICANILGLSADNWLGNLLIYCTDTPTALKILDQNILQEYGIKVDLNYIPNGLKHFKEDFCEKEHEIRKSAFLLICRGLTNYNKFQKHGTPTMDSFIKKLEEESNYIDKDKNSVPSSVSSVNSVVKKNNTDLNTISGQVIDCAIQVHKALGPGLLESAYQHALAYALTQRGLSFQKEITIPVRMDDLKIDAGYRADFIIEDTIILEIKSVEKLAPIHDAQILTYMRLGHFPLGLLLNFNEQLLKNGIKRFKL